MFEDVSRPRPRIRGKVPDGTFDLSVRPWRPAIHDGRSALGLSGRSLPHGAAPTGARPIRMAVKRGLDAGFALLALIALCVPMVLIVIIVRPRLVTIPTDGRSGKQFGRLNFAFDAPAGRLLRETGLERLPELINVLKGEMSLVGPTSGSNGDPAARPGLVGPSEPSGPKPLSLLDDLSILVSIVLGRQG